VTVCKPYILIIVWYKYIFLCARHEGASGREGLPSLIFNLSTEYGLVFTFTHRPPYHGGKSSTDYEVTLSLGPVYTLWSKSNPLSLSA